MDGSYVQADVKILDVYLEKIGETKTKITFEFHGNMKGWMPTWLMNIIQKKWPLRFIQGLRKRMKDLSPRLYLETTSFDSL